MRFILLLAGMLILGYAYFNNSLHDVPPFHSQQKVTATPAVHNEADLTHVFAGSSDIDRAFASRQRDVQVTGQGVVIKSLADDREGSRHQRFILKLPSGLTVLIAHNIDLARRLNNLQAGDVIEFHGEYVWNEKGGVVHWTHKDPQDLHPPGWLKYKGELYQ